MMLSIRSLTAELSSDPALLLNNAEMTRIPWKKGRNPGEIIVEMDDLGDPMPDLINIGRTTSVTYWEGLGSDKGSFYF